MHHHCICLLYHLERITPMALLPATLFARSTRESRLLFQSITGRRSAAIATMLA